MITSISTIRHARTIYNGDKRYAGSLDVPLSDIGRREAQAAAEKLKSLQLEVVVTSRLRRAFETAKIISTGAIPLVRTRLCNERTFGILEGLTWDEAQTLEPPILMIKVGNDLHTVNPKNAEPFEDVWERAKRFRRMLFRRYAGKRILVVSHGVFLQMFHGVLLGSNCIESLAVYPANLQVRRFYFAGEVLAKEASFEMADVPTAAW